MNPWSILFCYILLFLIILITGIISIVLIIKRKKKNQSRKPPVTLLVISNLFLLMLILFIASHPTYYKYNDWAILDSNINMVQQKYGDFDLGEVTKNKAGTVAYYIYTDNGPIMPDHLKHYYYIEYDEWGVVSKVYETVQPGG